MTTKRVLFLILFLATYMICYSQEDSAATTSEEATAQPKDTAKILIYTILTETTPFNPEIKASGDTVTFRISYVDMMCDDYYYELENKPRALIIRRISSSCDKNSDQMYAMKGCILHVSPGVYSFSIETVYGKKKELLFREAVKVK